MGDDEEHDPAKAWARHQAEMAEMSDQMDRTFGRRPKGQEHRVVIDHEQIAAVDPDDEHDWQRLCAYLGLDGLDRSDPTLPKALAALLAVRDPPPQPVLAWVGGGLATLAGLVLIGLQWGSIGPGAVVLLLPTAFVALLGALAGHGADAAVRALGLLSPLPTAADRRDAALERLRAAPFVSSLGGKLVENVPALSWLGARIEDLRAADERCDSRVREIDQIVERLAALVERLGQRGPDPQRDALLALQRDEKGLRKRIGKLRKAIEAKRADLSASLDRVRAEAELAAIREKSAALLGEPAPDAAARVAADLELEVSDLRKDFASLTDDLADEEARWKAVAEVAALR